MGKGKGKIKRWVAFVSGGIIFFEVGVNPFRSDVQKVRDVLLNFSCRLPFKNKLLVSSFLPALLN